MLRRPLTLSAGLALLVGAPHVLAAPATPVPAFTSYVAPGSMGADSGEPTLGVSPESGAVLFQAGLETLRVTDFDRGGRGRATWADASPGLANTTSFDPILESDPNTGRAWVSHLALACSLMAYTDDDGRTYQEVPFGCGAGSFFDHQTVGVGPFVAGGPLEAAARYPSAVYYCAQDIATARCSTSLDGGVTYLPAVTAFTSAVTNCGGLFGHLKTAPDGTAYLPPIQCDRGPAGFVQPTNPANVPGQSVAVSEDNGLTWTMRRVPGSTSGNAGHPSLGIGSDGSVYYAWGGKEGGTRTDHGGPPMVSVSRDRGQSWTRPYQLGREFKIRNTKFVTTVAGDGDRAAVAFLGTPTSGDDQLREFLGEWRLYVAFTYDRGRTWRTVNATPHSPVQVGSICTSGILCTGNTRNLLDFNDVVIDREGRVLAAIADGCLDAECYPSQRSAKATIVRQTRGLGLLRAYDHVLRRAR